MPDTNGTVDAQLGRWLAAELTDPGPFTLRPLGGGNSNETLKLASPFHSWVLRRPPAHAIAPSAHSMQREFEVLSTLASTPVAAPRPVALSREDEVPGAPFLLMEHVEGVSLTSRLPDGQPPEAVRLIGEAAVDALVALHGVDWREGGLGAFGHPDGFLARQVSRWRGQLERYRHRELPFYDELCGWLQANRPEDTEPAIVHGDFHVDNCLVSLESPVAVAAIIDWEMSTIGDPLLDLGLFLAFWGPERPERPAMPQVQGFSRVPGAPSRAELAQRYSMASGRSVERLDWYMAFSLFKLASIVEGAYAQHVEGRLDSPYAAALEYDVPALLREAAGFAGLTGAPNRGSGVPRVTGIDEQSVGAWLEATVTQTAPPFAYRLIAGGRSNLTFEVTDAAGERFVLRRPPLGNVLESAHDMPREFRIISALEGRFPVATPLGLCTDPAVNGAPFYVMSFVDGVVLRDAAVVERDYPAADRTAVGESLIDALADLHLLVPGEIGLGELGRHDGYVERQLRRWHRQWLESKQREIPLVEEVHRRLERLAPEPQRLAIVHGDYRLDNTIFGPGGRMAAVLDWELCTLGDPLADVAGLRMSWVDPGENADHLLSGAPTMAGGFPSWEDLLERYARRTGLDVSRLGFYVAFAYWRMACIGEGVYARYRAGAMGDDSLPDIERFGERIARLAERADEELRRL